MFQLKKYIFDNTPSFTATKDPSGSLVGHVFPARVRDTVKCLFPGGSVVTAAEVASSG